MNRRPRFLVDVDGVVADLVGHLCSELAPKGFLYRPEDIVTYEFEKCMTPEANRAARLIMARPGFCSTIPWYLGGRAFLQSLNRRGQVVAVTKPPPEGATWAHERTWWLRDEIETLPVISTDTKQFVHGDWLIEDSVANAMWWQSVHAPLGRALIIDRPWNRSEKWDGLRAKCFAHALEIIDRETT